METISEKGCLPQPTSAPAPKKPSRWAKIRMALVIFNFIWLAGRLARNFTVAPTQAAEDDWVMIGNEEVAVEFCEQVDAIYPSKHQQLAEKLKLVYDETDFVSEAAELLGGAVRVPYV